MTKEAIFKNFINDPLILEKGYLTKEKAEGLKFIDPIHDPVSSKLVEVIRLAISGTIDGENEGVVKNKIQKLLNF